MGTLINKVSGKKEDMLSKKAPQMEVLLISRPLAQNILNYILNSSCKGSEIVALTDALRALKPAGKAK